MEEERNGAQSGAVPCCIVNYHTVFFLDMGQNVKVLITAPPSGQLVPKLNIFFPESCRTSPASFIEIRL